MIMGVGEQAAIARGCGSEDTDRQISSRWGVAVVKCMMVPSAVS